ncbi:MAG: hypothetical protein FJZ58_02200 [Chlamydiae bacterium]|nr:hypothetical protein [Chlamydiota bacterium]
MRWLLGAQPPDTGDSWISGFVSLLVLLVYFFSMGKRKKKPEPSAPKHLVPPPTLERKAQSKRLQAKKEVPPTRELPSSIVLLPKRSSKFSLRRAVLFSEILRRPYE